jgi:hypothetical protein
MARKDENGGSPETPVETVTAQTAPTFRAVEDHAKALGISAPIFIAVRTREGWWSGKKVEKTEFEKAVKDFLGAPMGGK